MSAINESELKRRLRIKDWNEFSSHKVLKYIKLLPEIEKHLHLKVLGEVPHFIAKTEDVVDVLKSVVLQNQRLSVETKQTYKGIINALKEMLKKDNLTEEEHEKIYEDLIKVASLVNDESRRDAEFSEKLLDNTFKTLGTAIFIVAAIFGLKGFLVK